MEDSEVLTRLGLEVQPIINAAGVMTTYGGASMPDEVVEAMVQATRLTVRVDELQAAASRVIARLTGAEAGYVTCGCSAAMTLAAAACMTGYDADRINRLPDTSSMPNEILVASSHRCGYDHAIRAAGARILNVGMSSGVLAPGQNYSTLIEDYAVAIADRTAAIAYFDGGTGAPCLEEVVALGREYGLPVIVDAANTVPPISRLRDCISTGVDLIAVSGGKGLCAPQQSGLLVGRHDLIAAAALNCYIPDFSGGYDCFDRWSPPPSLVIKDKLRGVPHQPIGRGLKVSKEAIVGILTALQLATDDDRIAHEAVRLRSLLSIIEQRLRDIDGVHCEVKELASGSPPVLVLCLDSSKMARSMAEVSLRLRQGKPPIYVLAPRRMADKCVISALSLDEAAANEVAERLYDAITSK